MASSSRHPRSIISPSSSYLPGPISRRTASSGESRPYVHTYHRAASSSALSLVRIRPFSRSPTPVTPPPHTAADHRLSRLLPSSLGSPYLIPSESPQVEVDDLDLNALEGRPPSPAPTADFSIIDADSEDSDSRPYSYTSMPGSYPTCTPKLVSSLSRGRQEMSFRNTCRDQSSPIQNSNSVKSLLPRLLEALSSPTRTILNFSPAINPNSSSSSCASSRTNSPSAAPRRRPPQSWYTNNASVNGRHSPPFRASGSLGKSKGKAKVGGIFASRNGVGGRKELGEQINYSELAPLDGEEGELIDDEACFIDAYAVTGIDILAMLPTELALHVLSLVSSPCSRPAGQYLTSPTSPSRSSAIIAESDADHHEALQTLLSCRLVSRTWCRLASDNATWRPLFLNRWGINLRIASDPRFRFESFKRVKSTIGATWDYDMVDISEKAKRVLGLSYTPTDDDDIPIWAAPLRLDWRMLYRERLELEHRWIGSPCLPVDESGMTSRLDEIKDTTTLREEPVERIRYEPKPMRIAGHSDSVYCLEFDSRRIITGSRDKKIKVWSLQSGRLLGTFKGYHTGSVLCLKFEKDWDREWNLGDDEESLVKGTPASTGFMVSGSSDCTICVWDLHIGPLMGSDDACASVEGGHSLVCNEGERQIKADVRTILRGHSLGVLDIRMDKRWIVSCSKDADIRVWNRKTMASHRVLRGHEGPVNAVGLQNGRVVSASGDGKLILWDIESGERLRTFEGHNRGLACIEYKGDLIISGSNDCKIKIWSASTGECLRDLTGHEALVRALSFDARSGRLVSASYDRSIKVWDLASGRMIREFKGNEVHTSNIFDVKFDASRLVSASHDQKIVVHDFSVGLNTALFI